MARPRARRTDSARTLSRGFYSYHYQGNDMPRTQNFTSGRLIFISFTVILLTRPATGQDILPPPGEPGIPMIRTVLYGPVEGEALATSFVVRTDDSSYVTVVTVEAEDLDGAPGVGGTTYQEIGRWICINDAFFDLDIMHNRWSGLRSYRIRATSLHFFFNLPGGRPPLYLTTVKTITARLPAFRP